MTPTASGAGPRSHRLRPARAGRGRRALRASGLGRRARALSLRILFVVHKLVRRRGKPRERQALERGQLAVDGLVEARDLAARAGTEVLDDLFNVLRDVVLDVDHLLHAAIVVAAERRVLVPAELAPDFDVWVGLGKHFQLFGNVLPHAARRPAVVAVPQGHLAQEDHRCQLAGRLESTASARSA
eukprot:CAMPEP_0184196354 /NCGR_PEP_ID=MMETSP0976-20121227/5461_1 /TAXON_ID=483370 /ORGANISM="non described non described, Strain CCMP2097" /LENGTH=184 /DNA_ID=CAMNT_0026500805 /DNA_START=32 /DNA_END=582 /DNA_ORIENTATION=+